MTKTKPNKKTSSKTKATKHSYSLAKSDNGTIQVTFTIPFLDIKKSRDEAVKTLGKDIEIPGFRKGKAPKKQVLEKISQETLMQNTLSRILPKLISEVIEKEKLKLAMYPKFELIKAEENKSWEIRAITCNFPKVNLAGYKEKLKGVGKSAKIWTPGSNESTDNKEEKQNKAQKEQEVIKLLLETIKIDIPELLIIEEVNRKLASLLERIEKLGLELDSYLKSVGKDAKILRKEYKKQAEDGIALEIILGEIARGEKLVASKTEIDSAINAASADPKFDKNRDTAELQRYIASVMTRRKALDFVISIAS